MLFSCSGKLRPAETCKSRRASFRDRGQYCIHTWYRLCFYWWGGRIEWWKGETAEMEGAFESKKSKLLCSSIPPSDRWHMLRAERERGARSLTRYCFVQITYVHFWDVSAGANWWCLTCQTTRGLAQSGRAIFRATMPLNMFHITLKKGTCWINLIQ